MSAKNLDYLQNPNGEGEGEVVKNRRRDRRKFKAIVSPEEIASDLPLNRFHHRQVNRFRAEIEQQISGEDKRLLVIVGPCSIHDPSAAYDYAQRLKELREKYADQLNIVMRVYFEKPRTSVGWKGLISDPNLDGSFDFDSGLRLARKLLRDILELGVPTATEFLDPIVPQYISALVSWAAIGARTSESQIHREIASGLTMPVGFKNAMDGNVSTAVNSMIASSKPQSFLGINNQGRASIVSTPGNSSAHVVLRGGSNGPNYSADAISAAAECVKASFSDLENQRRILVDCSHGNSRKNHKLQPTVAQSVVDTNHKNVLGLMIESFIVEGRQETSPDMTVGQSITDACIGWADTSDLLDQIAAKRGKS